MPGTKVEVEISDKKVLTDDLKINKYYLTEYDIYVLDFFSTVSNIIIATDKPILYFNLGLMNINPRAMSDFKKRVFWYDVNLGMDFDLQIKDAFDKFYSNNQHYENTFSEKYCISDDNTIFFTKSVFIMLII
jgi:hypothetical protein